MSNKVTAWIVLIIFALTLGFGGAIAFDELTTVTWDESDYQLNEDTFVMYKDPGEDFVILNLTDTQMAWVVGVDESKEQVYNTITRLVDEVKPDLITLTGDNVWLIFNKYQWEEFIPFMDSFGIPWAPVFGNHDGEIDGSNEKVSDYVLTAKNALFVKSVKGVSGYGNYVINIVEKPTKRGEKGRIVYSLIMLDSHSSDKGKGYSYIKTDQIAWYEMSVRGLKDIEGKTVPTIAMFHIPLFEYKDAYEYWEESGFDPAIGFGEKNEGVACSYYNSGLFDVMKELGSTTDVIVGHDHINSYSVLYEGIRLTYGLKTGCMCYYEPHLNGGTKIIIPSEGKAVVSHVYINEPVVK